MITQAEIDHERAAWPFGDLGELQARRRIEARRIIEQRQREARRNDKGVC